MSLRITENIIKGIKGGGRTGKPGAVEEHSFIVRKKMKHKKGREEPGAKSKEEHNEDVPLLSIKVNSLHVSQRQCLVTKR